MKSKLQAFFHSLFSKTSAWDYDVRIDGVYYKLDAVHSTAEVVSGGKEYCNRVVVPAGVEHGGKDYRVVGVGNGAFYECSSLVFVDLPKGIVSIGDSAFQGCTALQSLSLPEGLTIIGTKAFAGCSSLKQIVLPDSLKRLGAAAFKGCYRLRALALPCGIEAIEKKCFAGCSSLQQIVIPAGVKNVGEMAFFKCASLKTVVAMPPVAPAVSGAAVFEGLSPQVSLHYPAGCDYTAWTSYFADMKTFAL